ncbi:hypothetical protein EVAR_18789_1 [Eumeta japonica]|uniref:Uncharacterized protein n=1 Tax=Eumeta variegata TaxID=151549 RepID=A0A4C1ULJ1_EUMVA|nr:hypothetical protein EVAR_18789_1 [Eumeta japonica]
MFSLFYVYGKRSEVTWRGWGCEGQGGPARRIETQTLGEARQQRLIALRSFRGTTLTPAARSRVRGRHGQSAIFLPNRICVETNAPLVPVEARGFFSYKILLKTYYYVIITCAGSRTLRVLRLTTTCALNELVYTRASRPTVSCRLHTYHIAFDSVSKRTGVLEAKRNPGRIRVTPAPRFFTEQSNFNAGHSFDCTPDPTSVFYPSSVLRVGPGPACDSVPTRFYSRPVRNSLPHLAFNLDFATSHNSDVDEAEKISSYFVTHLSPIAPKSESSEPSYRLLVYLTGCL